MTGPEQLGSVGLLPISPALAEASSDSLTELFSRDPQGFSQRDRDRLIEELRAQRVRLKALEDAGTVPKAGRAKPAKGPVVPVAAPSDLELD